jgi:hypothetical protein
MGFARAVMPFGLTLIAPDADRPLIIFVREAAIPVWAGAIVALLMDTMTKGGSGEPLTLQGASIWPTILLRALGIVLSISLIVQVFWQAHKNLYSVAEILKIKVRHCPTVKGRIRWWRRKHTSGEERATIEPAVCNLLMLGLRKCSQPTYPLA